MEQKEKFYLEVLELEPGSRLFFPLAEIYAGEGRLQEARDVLTRGLKHHPGHFEARMLLASVCYQQNDYEASRELVREIFSGISSKGFFWELILQDYREAGREEMALALQILAAESKGRPLSLAAIMQEGLKNILSSPPAESAKKAGSEEKTLSGEQKPDPGVKKTMESPAPDEDAEEVEDLDFEEPAWTRSMADILYRQQEYEQALRIYRHLWSGTMPGSERRELEEIISELEGLVRGESEQGEAQAEPVREQESSGDPFMETLNKLAARLEQRAEE
ncbi:MAG: tetratricopeptide repeat protein [Desulfonatronovibrionaceae bacterium]